MSLSELPMVWGRYLRYEGTIKVLIMARSMHFWPRGQQRRCARVCKACVKRKTRTCLRDNPEADTALHDDGLSSLKLFNSPDTGPWGRARHRWSINCDALK
eukprot:3303920-Prymnesium_polylepis.2